MRIGEFAKVSGIPASALRLYDQKGLLIPDYIDSFTGYRHYSAGQIETVRQINLLKQSGFTLREIRKIIENPDNKEYIKNLLACHETDCRSMLDHLKEAKLYMVEQNGKLPDMELESFGITEETDGDEILLKSAPLPQPLDPQDFKTACSQLEEAAVLRDYQRVSGFMSCEDETEHSIRVAIRTLKLTKEPGYLCENIDIPFENDEQVIGKWKVLGSYAVKEDFFSGMAEGRENNYGNVNKEIYFLPNGEKYWVYGWTKGYLILENGEQQCLCRYEVEEHDGKRYMFVEDKEYEFRRGGRPLALVLEQADQKRYSAREIMIEDDLDIPFEDDARVLGTWNVYDLIRKKEDFTPGKRHRPPQSLFFKKMCFEKNGIFTSRYGDEDIGSDAQSWTKGYVLRYYNHTACAYEIVTVDGTDYMIIEWKSGDYRWGGKKTNYYVFVRE